MIDYNDYRYRILLVICFALYTQHVLTSKILKYNIYDHRSGSVDNGQINNHYEKNIMYLESLYVLQ